MRIRSLKPAFWTSEDVAQLEECVALHFAGLWNYAQDNGVGRDDARLIRAALYPLREAVTVGEVERRQDALADAGLIQRYTVAGVALFYIPTWDSHQRVSRPSHCKYERPSPGAIEPSRSPHGGPDDGVGNGEWGMGSRNGVKELSGNLAADAARSGNNPMGQIMAAVRLYLYAPDGKPPADWSDRRDASIAKALLERGDSISGICDAIEGIRLAVDRGDLADWTPPAKPGDKLTLRVLYHTKHGILPTWTVALNALDDTWKAGGPRKPSRPLAIDSMLGGGGHGATD